MEGSVSGKKLRTSLLDGGHTREVLQKQDAIHSWPAPISTDADVTCGGDGLRRHRRERCLASVRHAIIDELRPYFARSGRIALLGVPPHGNLGDNVLHLAAAQLTAMFGTSPAIECTYIAREPGGILIRECPPPGVLLDMLGDDPLVFFHAGGNWGDIWHVVQPWRMAYLTQLEAELRTRNTSARVIQLPQSAYYLSESAQAADVAVVQALQHINLTMYARQASSLAYTPPPSDRVAVKLMPDIAFLLNPVQAPEEPEVDVLLLLRTDRERHADVQSQAEVLDLARSMLGPLNVTFAVRDWVLSDPLAGELEPCSATGFALSRWVTAQKVIGSGKVVITDRLHASIVALLLDRPHIMIDNTYGKVSGVRRLALQGRADCGDDVLRAHHVSDVRSALQVVPHVLQAEGSGFV